MCGGEQVFSRRPLLFLLSSVKNILVARFELEEKENGSSFIAGQESGRAILAGEYIRALQ